MTREFQLWEQTRPDQTSAVAGARTHPLNQHFSNEKRLKGMSGKYFHSTASESLDSSPTPLYKGKHV